MNKFYSLLDISHDLSIFGNIMAQWSRKITTIKRSQDRIRASSVKDDHNAALSVLDGVPVARR